MRKIFFSLIIVMGFFLVFSYNVNAQENEEGQNLLDLKKVNHYNERYYIKYDGPVEIGANYTLFIERRVYGEDDELFNDIPDEVVLIYYGGDFTYDVFYQADFGKNEYGRYVEFSPTYDMEMSISIANPSGVILNDPKFSLYIGKSEDFKGFSNFKDGPLNTVLKPIVHFVEKENPVSIETITNKLVYISPNNSLNIVLFEDNYTNAEYSYGDYKVIYHILDQDGNLVNTQEVILRVVDSIPLEIIGPDVVVIQLADPLYKNKLLAEYTITDNNEVTDTLKLYAPQLNIYKLGDYEGKLSIFDHNNQEVTKSITIRVLDTKPPRIGCYADRLYHFTDQDPFTEQEIKDRFKVVDDIDDEVIEIELINYQNYLDNAGKVGQYTVTLKATDSSNNSATKDIIISVTSRDTLQVLVENRFFLTIEEADQMTIQDIREWFIEQLNENGIDASHIEVVHSEYETNSEAGRYYVSFTYHTKDGSFKERIAVDVIDKPSKTLSPFYISLITISALLIAGGSGYFIYYKLKKRNNWHQ